MEETKLIPIKYKNQKELNEYAKVLFDNGEIILTEDIQMNSPGEYTLTTDWFGFGYHLPEDTKFNDVLGYVKYKHFYNGEYCGCIEKEQVADFIGALSFAMEEAHKLCPAYMKS